MGHLDACGSGQQAVGGAGDGVGVEQVLPHHSQGPLGHDVGEDEDGAEVFPPGQVGAGDQEGEHSAEEDGHQAGAHGQIDGVQQGGPQVGLGQGAGEQVDVVHQGIAGGLAGEMGIDGAGVDLEGVLHNGHDGGDGGDGHHDAHQQQDHVVRLGQEGPEPVPEDGGPCGAGGRGLVHMRHSSHAGMEGRPWRQLGSKGALLCVSSKPALSAQRSGDAGDGAQPALYLSSISIQLPTVKETEAQYSGSSRTSLPSLVHQS